MIFLGCGNPTNQKESNLLNPLIFNQMPRWSFQTSLFRRLMAVGFIFFLVKGLVWLGIGALVYFGLVASGD